MNSLRRSLPRLTSNLQNICKFSQQRWISNRDDVRKYQNELFDLEKKRQHDAVGRIEKIEVRYLGLPEDTTLIMNKNLSTPYNCAQHLSDIHCNRSAIALIDGVVPWDMHRPFEDSCTLQLLNFTVAEPYLANRAFWRSCSFMLGAALSNVFKDTVDVQLHSFPSPNVKSGSFVYDISLNHQDCTPNKEELRTISAEMVKMAAKDLKFERLEVVHDLAFEIFKNCPFKREQLPSISRDGSVIIYRVGDHIDISRGPMMGSTALLGRCTIGAAFKIADINSTDSFYRVQGVALPKEIVMNHYAFSILENRIKEMNPARLPTEPADKYERRYGKLA
ncbi:39S ribosomal protein L39, mitochondrial [Contarinia nasturtii]|uniref:39S ribosomal protein L39, mitochondrial n=1 Tax=Contarinia nasturtii TaxID=265458 RepID=UPI0012D3C7BA|nr:39S ribosomal protein L39, mitochondrial [Contarinia nasturtii]